MEYDTGPPNAIDKAGDYRGAKEDVKLPGMSLLSSCGLGMSAAAVYVAAINVRVMPAPRKCPKSASRTRARWLNPTPRHIR